MTEITQSNQYPIFKFGDDSKAVPITKDLLGMSLEVTDSRGNPLRNRPVQSWALLDQIETMVKNHNINYDLDPIYVQKNSSHIMLTKDEKLLYNKDNTPINKWLFDKMITKLNLLHVGDAGENVAIAVSYHDRGIQIAWGLNVRICQNLSIMGGSKSVLQTYGSRGEEKDSFGGVMAQLEGWIRNYENRRLVDMQIMDAMKQRAIEDPKIIQTTIGKLYEKAVDQAYFSKQSAPFTINSMSNFVQEMIAKRRNEEKIATVWDLFNWGTAIIKPGLIDISDAVQSSADYAEFLLDEFSLV